MAFKQNKHLFTGMSRDLSDDKQKSEYYIDAHNIRITARKDTTLLSVTNEKGNKKLEITGENSNSDDDYNGSYLYVGHAVLNNFLVLFVKSVFGKDCIWRINLKTKKSKKLYEGNLNLSQEFPIETLADYETEDIQKIYWTDGRNQPRVINIIKTYSSSDNNIDSQFDFIPEVYNNGRGSIDKVYVRKIIGTGGIFKAGTIQYFITYYNKFGQESNVVWQSPLLYISPNDRGGSPTETVANSFELTIYKNSNDFDYIRIYSIQHTSENTDLIGRRIIDLHLTPDNDKLIFIDDGVIGESIVPSDLYYKGGIPAAIGTMTAKDQTLFLGNIKNINNQTVSDNIKDAIKNLIVNFNLLPAYKADEPIYKYYDYYNQLNEEGQDEEFLQTSLIDSTNRNLFITHSITTYKYLETYRFGLQFQDKWGVWSEPVFIGDFSNKIAPKIQRLPSSDTKQDEYVWLPIAKVTFYVDLVNELKNNGYVKVRPLVVLPKESERECVAQGVLCPTVYNVQDRIDNSPFAQPSWFFRPYWPVKPPYSTTDDKGADYGTLLPYAHNGLILGGLSLKGEIEKSYDKQGYYTTKNKIRISSTEEKDLTRINNPKDFYYIDQSLITLNSPDIEFGNISTTEGLKFRVIGALNVTGFYGSMYLETENSPNNFYKINEESSYPINTNITAYGWYKKDVFTANYNGNDNAHQGWRILGNGPYWLDVPYFDYRTDQPLSEYFIKPYTLATEFIVYPWQSTGSLGGGSFRYSGITAPLNGNLKHKIISNIRYSPETIYLTEYSIENYKYDTSDIQISNETINPVSVLNVSNNLHYTNNRINYYNSIDKLLSVPKSNDTPTLSNDSCNFDVIVSDDDFNTEDSPRNNVSTYKLLRKKYEYTGYTVASNFMLHTKYTATSITYRSTQHAVIALSPDENVINILPSINIKIGGDVRKCGIIPEYEQMQSVYAPIGDYNLVNNIFIDTDINSPNYKCVNPSFWQSSGLPTQYVNQKTINQYEQSTAGIISPKPLEFKQEGGILLLGELYRDKDSINKFGGNTDDAIEQNLWIPAGESKMLTGNVEVIWKEGDTYFQRYDCLKTYPYSDNNENNIVEILSFMCESRINIAGRYDKNRGLLDNTYITNENFNLINTAYNQKNNFFSYRILDDRFNTRSFKNQITWTKAKSSGALIDNWTNVTLANTLDLDGDKGEIISLNKYKNDIIAFQPKGISQIIYNPNVQINTASGLPIEIANSGKVQGKRYLYEGVGCQNKWSICDEVYGSLYFIDNLAKSIYKLDDQGLVSLTDIKGFKEWMNNNNTIEPWKPYNGGSLVSSRVSKNFRTFYDKIHKDLYFVNKNTCLVYSALLDQFTSFMDYQLTDAMFNVDDKFYSFYKSNNSITDGIWEQFAGNYNNIYGEDKDYYITFIDNAIPEMNKIYTNLEYRSDTYVNGQLESDQTFDTIRVYNEYQDTGERLINTVLDKPYLSDLQKKFRVWRIHLPRDKDNPLNRINNTWTKITLRKTGVKNEKTVLHDAIVGYYI